MRLSAALQLTIVAGAYAMAGAAAGNGASGGHPERPPPAHTGGFGEPTCLACHFDGELNPPGGSLTVAGWPRRPAAGRSYSVEVRLSSPGMERAGFQLSVRNRAGRQAGRLVPVDMRTAVTDSAGVSYVHHAEAGSRPVRAGRAVWRFRWTAPAGRAPLILHVAANAANGDASALGDAIYAGSLLSDR